MNRMGSFSAVALALAASAPVLAAETGEELKNVQIRDANDEPASIPDFGEKVLAIFYNDADAADLNDPLADALKAKNYDKAKYRGIGIADLKDSKAPNFLIRKIVRGKIEKYNSTILTDKDLAVPAAWGLGDCNNTSIFILLGRDRKVKRIQRGAIRGADIDAIVALVDELVKEP